MNSVVLISAVLATCYVSGSASPVSGNAGLRAAKRSDEVIFFDEGSQGSMLASKRSQKTSEWANKLGLSNKVDKEEEVSKPAASVNYNSKNGVRLDDELVEEIEEEAFYDALSFLVEKIVDEAYDYDLEEVFDGMKSTKIVQQGRDSEEMQLITTTSVTEMEEESAANSVNDEEPAADLEDAEASQLENLMSSEKKSQPLVHLHGYLKQGTDPKAQAEVPANSGLFEAAAGPIEDSSEQVNSDSEEKSGDLEDYGGVVQYIEYLNTLKALENKLQSQLDQHQGQVERTDDTKEGYGGYENYGSYGGYGKYEPANEAYKPEETHGIRKKRSFSNDIGQAKELELMGRIRDETEENEQANDGVFFTVKEAEDLKQLLIELAKERLESEELIKYLLDNLDEVYALDAPEPQPLVLDEKPSFYEPEIPLSLYKPNPRQYERFQPAYGEAELTQLASRLGSRYNSGYEAEKRQYWLKK